MKLILLMILKLKLYDKNCMFFSFSLNIFLYIEYLTIIVCLEILFSKNLYNIETNQFICTTNQLTGFYVIQIFMIK